MLNRRRWLLAGVPVAVLVTVCSVASVSLFPPAVRGKGLGYAVAAVNLYVAPRAGLVENQPIDVTENLIEQAIALAGQLSSPEALRLIASHSGIPAGQIAVDGPLDVNESVFVLQPDGEKRAAQIVVQNAPYRVTIDEDTALPEISVTTQAPTPRRAIRLASATKAAASSYLTGVETRSGTPSRERLEVSSLGPIAMSNDATKGLVNLAMLIFLLSFALWYGLVTAGLAIVRDVRRLRRGWEPGRASP